MHGSEDAVRYISSEILGAGSDDGGLFPGKQPEDLLRAEVADDSCAAAANAADGDAACVKNDMLRLQNSGYYKISAKALDFIRKDFSAYCRFYAAMAKRLKREFPEIKVGGPAISEYAADLLSQFIDYCRQENAPLDFCSWHAYTASLDDITSSPAKVRRLLDERGFTETELHLDEWHYFNCAWDEVQGTKGNLDFRVALNNGDHGLNGIDAAAFDACALILWQDTPLDSSSYYCTTMATDDNWGLIDKYGFPFKTYYAFRMFGEMTDSAPNRIRCGGAPENIAILGGTGGGAKRLMVASFKEKAAALTIRVSGVPQSGTVTVESLETGKRREPSISELAYTDGVIDLGPIAGSTVKLIRFSPAEN